MRPNFTPQQCFQLFDFLNACVEDGAFDNVPDFQDSIFKICDALRETLLGWTVYLFACEPCEHRWEIIGKLAKHPDFCPTCKQRVSEKGTYVFRK